MASYLHTMIVNLTRTTRRNNYCGLSNIKDTNDDANDNQNLQQVWKAARTWCAHRTDDTGKRRCIAKLTALGYLNRFCMVGRNVEVRGG